MNLNEKYYYPGQEKTILFFDDGLIQEYRGLERVWFTAEPWPGYIPSQDPLLQSSFSVPTVTLNAETGEWRMWAGGNSDISRGDEGCGLYLYRSQDGLEWEPCFQDPPVDKKASDRASHLVFSGEYAGGGPPFYDEREPDPRKRYKLTYSDLSSNPVAQHTCKVATSPDGIHWSIDREAIWNEQHCDGGGNIQYNPYTGKYQFFNRPILGDRRIAIYQTKDWKTFDRPLIVLHPDPLDPPMIEFYCMFNSLYEGYYMGFLPVMYGSYHDTTIAPRFDGKVETELTYSLNGICWNRTSRRPFLPGRGWGSKWGIDNFSSVYGACMVLDREGWIRIYATSCVGEHDDVKKFEDPTKTSYMSIFRLRRDGFCALETSTDMGHLTMRPLISHGGKILVNAVTAQFGKIRAELRMVPDNKPIPGFELENSVPVSGDGHFLELRWKEKDNIDCIRGLPFRIFLELDQARIYAIRVDATYLFGYTPETDLNGSYIPNQIPGCKPGQERKYAGICDSEDDEG